MTIILGNLINKLSTLFRKSQYKKVHDHIDRFDHLGDETVNMVKMVNTKNDVRKVRNVRILKMITILSANFYTSGKIGRRYFKSVQNYQKWIKKYWSQSLIANFYFF